MHTYSPQDTYTALVLELPTCIHTAPNTRIQPPKRHTSPQLAGACVGRTHEGWIQVSAFCARAAHLPQAPSSKDQVTVPLSYVTIRTHPVSLPTMRDVGRQQQRTLLLISPKCRKQNTPEPPAARRMRLDCTHWAARANDDPLTGNLADCTPNGWYVGAAVGREDQAGP